MRNSNFPMRLILSNTAISILFFTITLPAQHYSKLPITAPGAKAAPLTRPLENPPKIVTIEELEKQIANNPADPINYNSLAALYIPLGRYDDALAALEKAVEVGPKISRLHLNLSLLNDFLGRRADSLKAGERAAELDAGDAKARMNLCTLYISVDRLRDAVSCFEILSPMMPNDPIVNVNYAFAVLKSGSPGRAVKILENVVAKNPRYSAAHNLLGAAQYKNKQYSPALASFKSAVEIAPDVPLYRYNLGISQMTRKNKVGALSQYKFVKETNPALAAKLYRYIYSDKLVFVGGLESIKQR